jgi:pilus assembly protein CpaE
MTTLTKINGGMGLAPRRMVIGADAAAMMALKGATARLGWGDLEEYSKDILGAVPLIYEGIPPALLIVDLDGEDAPLAALAALAEACFAETRVLAIGRDNDVNLYRRLLAAGVSDYLLKPLQPADLAAALLRADAAGDDHAEIQQPVVTRGAVRGRVIAVMGARGGAGATTLATSLAWMIADRGNVISSGQRCVLVDFDLHFGSAALALGLEPGAGLATMLANPERLDEHLISASLQSVKAGLGLFTTQVPVESEAPVCAKAAAAFLTALRSTAQWVVADLPRALDANARHILRTADDVVLVASPSLEGLRDMQRLLEWLVALRAGAPPFVVVNGASGGSGEVSRKLFEDTIGSDVTAWIPAMCSQAAAAAAHAVPLAAMMGGAKARARNPFAALAARITGEAEASRKSRLPGWWPKR